MHKTILLLSLLIITILFSGCVQQSQPQTTTTTEIKTTTKVMSTTAIQVTTTPTESPPLPPNKITIKSYSFNPSTLTVKVGTTVTWTNEDSTKHTVTSDSGNELNSQQLSQGQSYLHTFNQTGTFNYHCIIHYSMKGKVVVE